MTKTKSTKRALLMSALALLVCVSMLIGSTFAWFTDEVTSAGNIIKSGTLKVDLVDADGNSMAGQVINFVTADDRAQDQILWEPGCTYETEPVYVVNKGTLALKYKIVVNGIDGDAELLDVIDWTITVNGEETDLSDYEGFLLPGDNAKSGALVISGHMKEEAGNDYQDLTVEGISVTVYATQYTSESDSIDDQYDKDATYPVATVADLKAALAAGGNVVLGADVTIDANTAITVAAGTDVTLDLNGHTISATANKNGDQELFLVKGNMTVKNGSIELTAENNQGWNAMATIFDVTAGGVLNLDGVTANVSGTDMNFIVHLNNWGAPTEADVSLNADNCVFNATYCAVRVGNGGPGMNNVKITNSTLTGKTRAFWVHNYTSADFSDKLYHGATQAYDVAQVSARLNLDIYNNGNTFTTTDNTVASPIIYGFNNPVYYSVDGNVIA